MKTSRIAVFSLIFASFACTGPGPVREPGRFRTGIFLHHSTGECIWGRKSSSTSVPKEISKYNDQHGLAGRNAVSLDEKWWPDPDNEWVTWDGIFDNKNPTYDIRPFIEKNSIVMIKSCFPSSNMDPVSGSSDTLTPGKKSLYNFKWHWRAIVNAMRNHPMNFFVIWTNAPQVAGLTTHAEAAVADAACRWAKDTLAAGLDPEFGKFPDNCFVFDLFHKLADESGTIPLQYAASAKDPHPNAAAAAIVAPQLVNEMFDAAIGYESTLQKKASK